MYERRSTVSLARPIASRTAAAVESDGVAVAAGGPGFGTPWFCLLVASSGDAVAVTACADGTGAFAGRPQPVSEITTVARMALIIARSCAPLRLELAAR